MTNAGRDARAGGDARALAQARQAQRDCDELPGSAAHDSFLILTDRDYKAVRFVLDLVDRLGEAHGFDPADLINPRTKEPFGPWIERLRRAMRLFEAMPPAESGRAREDGNRPPPNGAAASGEFSSQARTKQRTHGR
jgi:hypothetical protein